MPDQSSESQKTGATASIGLGMNKTTMWQLSSSGRDAQKRRKEGKARTAAATAAAAGQEKKGTEEGRKAK